MVAPLVIFTYNRLDSLKILWDSLMECENLGNRCIYIFHDGLKHNVLQPEREKWLNVYSWLKKLSILPNVQIRFSEINKGLANSIHTGITDILKSNNSVIVLEDDLILAKSFLTYMDSALVAYKDRKNIYSISGYSHFKSEEFLAKTSDVFLFPRPNSWGWATWSDRWERFKLNEFDGSELTNYQRLKLFQKGGIDLPWMLRNQIKSKIDSWAIQWTWFQFNNSGYTVYPICSKVQNIGFGEDATHTSNLKGAQGEICERALNLPPDLQIDSNFIQLYRKKFKLGYLTRVKNLFWMCSLMLKIRNLRIF